MARPTPKRAEEECMIGKILGNTAINSLQDSKLENNKPIRLLSVRKILPPKT
jgi:hypothetical protein